MKKIILTLFVFPLSLVVGQQAWDYLGIPYVTDNVPGAIMPTLPTGADTAGWPYDPCTIATPTFVGGANQYYIDTENGDDSTAGNSGRGSVSSPRRSVPNVSGEIWTLNEGDQIFITANSTLWSAATDRTITANGTSTNPCWIIGVGGKPTYGGDKFFLNGQHILIDNLNFQATDGATRIKFGESIGGPVQYACMRHCKVEGLGTGGSGKNTAIGGNGNATTPSAFVVIYQCEIFNFGRWDRPNADGVDRHGIQPFAYAHYWWIIENEIYHMEGDSIQVGSSNFNNGDYAYRPHYIYIAGNDFYENYENSIDNKNCYHVIASQNNIHGFYNDYKSANNVAFILANDSEGWLASYQWAIFNNIWDSAVGIKVASNAAELLDGSTPPSQLVGQRAFVLGNRITDVNNGIILDARSTSPDGTNPPSRTWAEEVFIEDNTFEVTGKSLRQDRVSLGTGQGATYKFAGNLVYSTNAGGTTEVDMNNDGDNARIVINNLIYQTQGSVTLTTGSYSTFSGNVLNQDPLLASINGDDFRITEDSPAVGISEESSTYALFLSMYGINIQVDYDENIRPRDGTWDAGAYEFAGAILGPDNDVKRVRRRAAENAILRRTN